MIWAKLGNCLMNAYIYEYSIQEINEFIMRIEKFEDFRATILRKT
jgi:hypothetical protein